jgi:hypothetical protein
VGGFGRRVGQMSLVPGCDLLSLADDGATELVDLVGA